MECTCGSGLAQATRNGSNALGSCLGDLGGAKVDDLQHGHLADGGRPRQAYVVRLRARRGTSEHGWALIGPERAP
jgi:hypothetical protein